jgi:hypothetical protein
MRGRKLRGCDDGGSRKIRVASWCCAGVLMERKMEQGGSQKSDGEKRAGEGTRSVLEKMPVSKWGGRVEDGCL